MFPPKRTWKPAPMFPMIERDRTVIPRTSPSWRTTRYPSSVNAVVISEWSMAVSLQFDRLDAFFKDRKIDLFLGGEPVEGHPDDPVVLDDEVGPAADILAERI